MNNLTENKIPATLSLSDGWVGHIYQHWNFPPEVIRSWRRLVLGYGDVSIFLSDGWFENWWNAFGGSDQLFVLVLTKNGEVKAIFPCLIKSTSCNGMKRSVIGSITNDHTCHYDFVIDPDGREDALSHFIGALRRIMSDAEVAFEYMPSSGENTVSYVSTLRRGRTPVHTSHGPWAPWIELSGDWNQFLEALPRKLRSNLKRRRKHAEEKGKLEFEVIRQSDGLDETLDALFEIEARSWKGKEGTAIKLDSEVECFYRRLAHWAMKENCLYIFLLKLDGLPIAGSICISSGKTVYLLKIGYDELFGKLSPGSLLQAETLKYLFMVPEIAVYNFLGACDRWKMEWTSSFGESSSLNIYPKSLKGWGRYFCRHGWKIPLRQLRAILPVMDRERKSEGREDAA